MVELRGSGQQTPVSINLVIEEKHPYPWAEMDLYLHRCYF